MTKEELKLASHEKQRLRKALRTVRDFYFDAITLSLVKYPNRSYADVAHAHGVSEALVHLVAHERGLSREATDE